LIFTNFSPQCEILRFSSSLCVLFPARGSFSTVFLHREQPFSVRQG